MLERAAVYLVMIVWQPWASSGQPLDPSGPNASPSELVHMLASDQPREIAWAAYLSAQQGRRDLIPKLAALIAGHQQHGPGRDISEVPPDDAAILAVADALIRLRAQLPAETVTHLYPQFPAQTIILLSRAPHNTTSLLKIFQTMHSRDLWLAAGDLLALHPPRELCILCSMISW